MSLVVAFFIGAAVGIFLLFILACMAACDEGDDWGDGTEHAELEDWEDK